MGELRLPHTPCSLGVLDAAERNAKELEAEKYAATMDTRITIQHYRI